MIQISTSEMQQKIETNVVISPCYQIIIECFYCTKSNEWNAAIRISYPKKQVWKKSVGDIGVHYHDYFKSCFSAAFPLTVHQIMNSKQELSVFDCGENINLLRPALKLLIENTSMNCWKMLDKWLVATVARRLSISDKKLHAVLGCTLQAIPKMLSAVFESELMKKVFRISAELFRNSEGNISSRIPLGNHSCKYTFPC